MRDYKDTIQLPKTDFPMKGNLAQKEPELIEFWKKQKIYTKVQEKNKANKNFTLPDGPPYANGSIHMGHALNKILKDMTFKYQNLRGRSAAFIPGWDCHGLPIEHKVLKDQIKKTEVITDLEILKKCRAEASKWIETQRDQFMRLGVMADWDRPWRTMDKEYEAEQIRIFAQLFAKDLIYQGEKPVYWNWTLQTALADAEVEYLPHKSPSIYVQFPIVDEKFLNLLGVKENVSAVIWTTTPWTLPANVAISVHPEFKYGLFKTEGRYLVVAESLRGLFEKEPGLTLELKKSFTGDQFENLHAQHPFLDRTSLMVLGTHVTQDAGTGLVHTAPGHGADDFKVGAKYNLPVLCPVDNFGKYNDDLDEKIKDLRGINIFKANPMIIEILKSKNLLLAEKPIEHSYPHCWRSKTPLIFRTTPQWFLGLDLDNSHLRDKILAAFPEISFFPDWGQARLRAMIEGRPDWCLSRQRIWGVPIPILICKKTSKRFADLKVMNRIADFVAEGGVEAYWNTSPDRFVEGISLPQGIGEEGFVHGKDILDVWFDSGVCHSALQKTRPEIHYPADLYLEGSDQHRGWFNTSLISGFALKNQTPFKALLTHGFVNDPQGRKMSKSLGNVVDPIDVAQKSGAEIVRLWAASVDYGQDVPCGQSEFTRVTETYRKFRNTLRYMLGCLADFDPQTQIVEVSKRTSVDQWALHETKVLSDKIINSYDRFEFHQVYQSLNQFFTVTLSATYLDILKDRLYTWKSDGLPRKSSQSTFYDILNCLLPLMTPICSFLAEETYAFLPGKKLESILLAEIRTDLEKWENPKIAAVFAELLKVRTDVQKSLEELRAQKVIGSSLEAIAKITADALTYETLAAYPDLRELLIISDFQLKKGPYTVEVEKAPGEKCVRCWVFSPKISHDPKHPDVCPKCVEALT